MKHDPHPRTHDPTWDSGISTVEVLISAVLLTFAFAGMATLIMSNERSQVAASNEAIVRNALRNQAERIRGAPFEDILATYQSLHFSVTGLEEASGNVTIFTDETEVSDETAPLGFPRDLDGDGSATNPNISTSYMLLPIRLRVTWAERSDQIQSELYLLLSPEN